MHSESQITAAIRRFLKPLEKTGELFVVKIAGGPRQQPGLPDLCLVYRGRAIWLEVKAAGGKVTPLQQAILDRIGFAGGIAYVVRSVDDVRLVIELIPKS